MKVITIEELNKQLDNKPDNFYLIDVLSEGSFRTQHLPGAKNISNGPDFLSRFEQEVKAEKDAMIVVYCSSNTCQSSVQAGKALEQAGYTKVYHYRDGLAGWQEAGLMFEKEHAKPV